MLTKQSSPILSPILQSRFGVGQIDVRSATFFVDDPIQFDLGDHPGFEVADIVTLEQTQTSTNLVLIKNCWPACSHAVSESVNVRNWFLSGQETAYCR